MKSPDTLSQSHPNTCRNCMRTGLSYDIDTAVYTCGSCGIKYKRVLGQIVKGVRVYWLGKEIK